jgi:DNA helicase IV
MRCMPSKKQPGRLHRALLDVELDAAQRAAVERPPGGAMLVLGEAGHGKTTVALHRLAHLYRAAAGRFRAVFLVPSEGLARLLQPLVTWLGVDVTVSTYDAWATRQAKRAFRDLPRRTSKTATAGVARVKRDPDVRALLDELAARPPGVVDDDLDAPPPATKAHAHRGDLQHLFGDRRLMGRLARAGDHAIEEVLEHTRVQFLLRGEAANAHVDAPRLVTVDGRSLDSETPEHDAASFDVEDAAVMFELDRLRAARLGLKPTRPRAFDCVVVDEAQELAPLELALVGRSVAPEGTLVVAGDADQQIDPGAYFDGWDATMRELGAGAFERVVLEVGYRCPPEVVALARAVRDGVAVDPGRSRCFVAADERALVAWIAREVARAQRGRRDATACVVARTPVAARRLAEAMTGAVPRRLVLDGDFRQHEGADVTSVEQVKGLEFDHVIVADAHANAYPDEPPARRALYVALTRARRGVSLACIGAPSPLLG